MWTMETEREIQTDAILGMPIDATPKYNCINKYKGIRLY